MSDEETTTEVRRGFVPFVTGTSVDIRQAGALGIVSKGDLTVEEGGAQLMVTGGDLSIREGGAQTILSRGDVTIEQGGGLLVAGARVEVTDGWVGVALGANVDLRGARVALAPIQALCVGAGFGVAVAVARYLLRR